MSDVSTVVYDMDVRIYNTQARIETLVEHIAALIHRVERLEEIQASHARRLEHLLHAAYPQDSR